MHSAGVAPSLREGDGPQFAALAQALRRRRRLALSIVAITMVAGGLLTAWQRAYRPLFQGSFKLLVSDPINPEDRQRDPADGGGALESLASPGRGSANTATLIQVLSSPLLLSSVERHFGLEEGTLELRTAISTPKAPISLGGGPSGVLEVTLQWPDPVQGQAILERLSSAYLAYSLRQRQEKLTEGLAFLDQQAPELQARVSELQNRVAAFRQSTGFVEPVNQAEEIKRQQEQLSDSRKELEQQQARLEALESAVRGGRLNSPVFQGTQSNPLANPSLQGGSPSLSVKGGPAGGAFTNLLQDLTQVERQLAEAEAIYTEQAPQVIELRAKRDKLRPLLQRRELDAIRTSMAENQAQLVQIRTQQQQLALRFSRNPAEMKDYDALQQQLKVARDNLTAYIKARESFRLQVAQRTVPWSVVAPPRFKARPVKPSVPRNLLLSALLGSLAGIGLALLRDRLDHVFHTPAEVSEELAIPQLGIVPYLSGKAGPTISQALEELEGEERFAIKESLRNLFATFRLLRVEKPVRLVAITSSSKGEGKTTITALFAQTLAELGQRVLVVDADLRWPMLHRSLGAFNAAGLSNLITDPQLAIAEVVQHLQPGLDLLTAGPLPPDPIQLLSSERCAEVVEAIRQLPQYDLVLFDTPPTLLVGDPVLLAEHLDGLIFLVGLSLVNRDLPQQALRRLRETRVDVLGLLINQPVRASASARSYGYGPHHGGENGLESTEGSASPNQGLRPSLRAGSRRFIAWLDERE